MHRQSNRERIATGGKAIYGAPLGILMSRHGFRAFRAIWVTRRPGRFRCFTR